MGGETNGSLVANDEPSKEVVFGDILWVKLQDASWWPAQVVDEKSVSSANKPGSKGSSSDVLVRLYGSYIYQYADVQSSLAEFKKILVDNSFDLDDIMKKSLEQEICSLNASTSRKRQRSESNGIKASPKRSSKKDGSETKVSSKKQKHEKPKTANSPDIVRINLWSNVVEVVIGLEKFGSWEGTSDLELRSNTCHVFESLLKCFEFCF